MSSICCTPSAAAWRLAASRTAAITTTHRWDGVIALGFEQMRLFTLEGLDWMHERTGQSPARASMECCPEAHVVRTAILQARVITSTAAAPSIGARLSVHAMDAAAALSSQPDACQRSDASGDR